MGVVYLAVWVESHSYSPADGNLRCLMSPVVPTFKYTVAMLDTLALITVQRHTRLGEDVIITPSVQLKR